MDLRGYLSVHMLAECFRQIRGWELSNVLHEEVNSI